MRRWGSIDGGSSLGRRYLLKIRDWIVGGISISGDICLARHVMVLIGYEFHPQLPDWES